MKRRIWALTSALALLSGQAFAWGNHTLPAYRSFEKMPEVANASPVRAEPLEAFLKAQEKPLETLLASQEAWAQKHLDPYPARPAALAFKANAARSDDARRLAFLMALRLAPNSRLALYRQPDPRAPASLAGALVPHTVVNTLPEQPNSTYRFLAIKPGDMVSPIEVLASATDEPDYGMDINLWDDSPSDWGKVYGFGPLSFGNPALYFATQAPFHMGFFHEDRILYMAAPFIKKTFPLLRVHQFSSLAALAFRTGHDYWGWRFTGLALHYVQDLTQPYHSSLSPGNGSTQLIGINLLAMAGMPRYKDDMVVLLSNRHLALEKYQNQNITRAAQARQDTPLEVALRQSERDGSYPAWDDLYVRDVVSKQAYGMGDKLVNALLEALPKGYVSDPAFDFGAKEAGIDLLAEVDRLGPQHASRRELLDKTLAELLANFGSHSRNVVRGVLRAGKQP
jgi:hypothetical protein